MNKDNRRPPYGKIAKKDSYIRSLGDAFRTAIEMNKETSFVDAVTNRRTHNSPTKIDTQINELEYCFRAFTLTSC